MLFSYRAAGAFDDQLNSISGRAIFKACVETVLLYNCENPGSSLNQERTHPSGLLLASYLKS